MLHTVTAALGHLLDRAEGHVVIVSSGAGVRGLPWAAGLGATSAAQSTFGESLRHELSGTGVSLTIVVVGELATSLHDYERAGLPDWYRGGPGAASANRLAHRLIDAVERDARVIHHPGALRVLAAAHGLSPHLADTLLRRLRGATAAPRRD
jgi:short-subunit dehydrogenase